MRQTTGLQPQARARSCGSASAWSQALARWCLAARCECRRCTNRAVLAHVSSSPLQI